MTLITTRDARRAGMEPLTVSMLPTDPHLVTICRDMAGIPGTTWARVRSRMGRIEIWRIPNRPRAHSQGPKKEGPPRKRGPKSNLQPTSTP